jgi:lysozyme
MDNELGLTLVKNFEGCRLKAYLDAVGIWTIAWGRTTNVRKGDTCTQAQADEWLANEFKHFETRVRALVGDRPTTANQLGALTSFAYNCGIGALASSTLLKKHRGGYYAAAKLEFAKWTKGGGKTLPGLVKRRAAEAELYASR